MVACEGTNFTGCSFPESKLSDLNLYHVTFRDCDFSDSVLRNCVFQRLQGPRSPATKKFDLSTCSFHGADLTGSVFMTCDLTTIDFGGAVLERVAFDRCMVKHTDFTGAMMDGVRFTDCRIEKARLDLQGFISVGQSIGFELGG